MLSTGMVPVCFEIAKVVPVCKNGNKQEIKTYRPISFVPALSKVLEMVMHKRLYTFLKEYIV